VSLEMDCFCLGSNCCALIDDFFHSTRKYPRASLRMNTTDQGRIPQSGYCSVVLPLLSNSAYDYLLLLHRGFFCTEGFFPAKLILCRPLLCHNLRDWPPSHNPIQKAPPNSHSPKSKQTPIQRLPLAHIIRGFHLEWKGCKREAWFS